MLPQAPRPAGQWKIWAVAVMIGLSLAVSETGTWLLVQYAHPYSIPSSSMAPTLTVGDHVLAFNSTDVQRGDLVVLHIAQLPGTSPHLLVRRVIGIAGDRVACAGSGRPVTVNGRALHETYLFPGDAPSLMPFDVTVPVGQLWVMGDHRAISADSRYWATPTGVGTLPVQDVVGRVVARDFGLKPVSTPGTFSSIGLATSRPFPGVLLLAYATSAAGLVLFIVALALAVILIGRELVLRRRARIPRQPWPALPI